MVLVLLLVHLHWWTPVELVGAGVASNPKRAVAADV